jgi:beta-lactamase regulating signal transducer with metallopeptidase domain
VSNEFLTLALLDTAAPVATLGAEAAAPAAAMPDTPLPLFEIGIGVWLLGAAIFLVLRFSAYFRLRRDLLEGAREVGRADRIRLIETPGTNAPLAFGVLDPVIAMPEGFMAQHDRTSRDLAIAHELAHHRANDLLVNILVQPLFALHWFTPLAHYGWLALRRDQEAACDARVLASKPVEQRSAYANLIASTAIGPNASLAAPMACPVLGDKSIVHRLRSLQMTDISPRRRVAGYATLGAALLAVPLTASITYAETPVPTPPAAPAPLAAPMPPAPPAAPVPPAPVAFQAITEFDPNTDVDVEFDTEFVSQQGMVLNGGDSTMVIEIDKDGEEIKHRRVSKERRVFLNKDGEGLSKEEREAIMAEVRESLAEVDEVLANTDVIIKEALAEADAARTEVKMECRGGDTDVATTVEKDDGRTIYICKAKVMAHALSGLKEARAEIAKDSEMSSEMRSELLETLDEQIERWSES